MVLSSSQLLNIVGFIGQLIQSINLLPNHSEINIIHPDGIISTSKAVDSSGNIPGMKIQSHESIRNIICLFVKSYAQILNSQRKLRELLHLFIGIMEDKNFQPNINNNSVATVSIATSVSPKFN